MMKKLSAALLILALCFGALTGCGDIVIGAQPTPAPAPEPIQNTPGGIVIDPVDTSPKGGDITLNGSGASFTGSGVSISGSTVTIASPGS